MRSKAGQEHRELSSDNIEEHALTCAVLIIERLLFRRCHPEALFWPKDLPRCFRLNCSILAPAQRLLSSPRSLASAFSVRRIPGGPSAKGWPQDDRPNSIGQTTSAQIGPTVAAFAADTAAASVSPTLCFAKGLKSVCVSYTSTPSERLRKLTTAYVSGVATTSYRTFPK